MLGRAVQNEGGPSDKKRRTGSILARCFLATGPRRPRLGIDIVLQNTFHYRPLSFSRLERPPVTRRLRV